MSAQTPEIPSDGLEAVLGGNSASAAVSTDSSVTPSQTSNSQASAAIATGSTTSTTPATGTGSAADLSPSKASYKVSFHMPWQCQLIIAVLQNAPRTPNFMVNWEHSNLCKRGLFPVRVLPRLCVCFLYR